MTRCASSKVAFSSSHLAAQVLAAGLLESAWVIERKWRRRVWIRWVRRVRVGVSLRVVEIAGLSLNSELERWQ